MPKTNSEDVWKNTHFINVDLDIYSKTDLRPLVAALGKKIYVLHVGRHRPRGRTYCAHLELRPHPKSADLGIRDFCLLIQTLPRAERKLWDNAKARDFNIGVRVKKEPYAKRFDIAADTVRAAAKLGAQIVFTVYAPRRAPKPIDMRDY